MFSSISHKTKFWSFTSKRFCVVCALNCARILVVRALDCAQFLLHPALLSNLAGTLNTDNVMWEMIPYFYNLCCYERGNFDTDLAAQCFCAVHVHVLLQRCCRGYQVAKLYFNIKEYDVAKRYSSI